MEETYEQWEARMAQTKLFEMSALDLRKVLTDALVWACNDYNADYDLGSAARALNEMTGVLAANVPDMPKR